MPGAISFALVNEIYDCALEPSRWSVTLGRIAEHIEADAAVLILLDPLRRERLLVSAWNVDPEMDEAYQREFIHIDPTLTLGWFQDLNQPYSVAKVLGEQEFTASRLYREWLSKFGFHDNMQTVLARTVNRFCGLSFLRKPERGHYAPEHLEAVGRLAPHVRKSIAISDLIDVRSLGLNELAATLDLVKTAIILVDEASRILHANREGVRLLEDAESGLCRDGQFLSCRARSTKEQLQLMIELAAKGPSVTAESIENPLSVVTRDRRDLVAWVLPLDTGLRQELAAPFHAKVAVFVRALGDTSPLPGELFVKRFAITPAECRVLMLLTQGITPAEAADCLGISLTTVKTHMARLFEKTGTSGQPDLMRLAMSALAPAAPSR